MNATLPGQPRIKITVDGNEAAASVAYRLNEVCCANGTTTPGFGTDYAELGHGRTG